MLCEKTPNFPALKDTRRTTIHQEHSVKAGSISRRPSTSITTIGKRKENVAMRSGSMRWVRNVQPGIADS
jgi:hypothetical protein